VAELLCAVVVGEDDDLVFLLARILKLPNRYLAWAELLLVHCWASTWASVWATAAWTGKFPLSSLFYLFSVLFSELNLVFEFKFEFCFVLQVLKHLNINIT
jgi:hypothetical protein